ncbi:hypothetical protein PGT21_018364 [Puccinia graminis f. sp. tritici]|uniref:Uncharacterized protein n=1 Tax=Puccinia graminis f. sp. tritici TaxID=56615 RepID=A0A5B0RWK8_PUCGR|nr:hypothetical protein PGT21_018481 [Puccinia graminis f. sp. tritici]KAA1103449.1 hypothetical protein PGT21_018364 [Puccinia graminis f. sp. tritici]KAA1130346.1 hypothetical protein PGTUg99_019256 [Puccinia graminis f. sp. tritici]
MRDFLKWDPDRVEFVVPVSGVFLRDILAFKSALQVLSVDVHNVNPCSTNIG